VDGNGLYACIIVDGPASSHHGAAQETEEDAQLCFNCASTAFMCRACQPDDDDPTANLFCSDECFQKSHRLLLKTSSEQMAQHTTRDIKVMYPLCSGPMAGCEQDLADKYCMQCGVTACAHCMDALHSFLKASAHQEVDAEIAAAEAQMKEWTRQEFVKQQKQKKQKEKKSALSARPQLQRRARQPPRIVERANDGFPNPGVVCVEVNGVWYPLENSGPKPADCKHRNPCKRCNVWGHHQNWVKA